MNSLRVSIVFLLLTLIACLSVIHESEKPGDYDCEVIEDGVCEKDVYDDNGHRVLRGLDK